MWAPALYLTEILIKKRQQPDGRHYVQTFAINCASVLNTQVGFQGRESAESAQLNMNIDIYNATDVIESIYIFTTKGPLLYGLAFD